MSRCLTSVGTRSRGAPCDHRSDGHPDLKHTDVLHKLDASRAANHLADRGLDPGNDMLHPCEPDVGPAVEFDDLSPDDDRSAMGDDARWKATKGVRAPLLRDRRFPDGRRVHDRIGHVGRLPRPQAGSSASFDLGRHHNVRSDPSDLPAA